MDTIVRYVLKFKFVVKFGTDGRTNGRTNGDIEALADARRALKNQIHISESFALEIELHFIGLPLSPAAKPESNQGSYEFSSLLMTSL